MLKVIEAGRSFLKRLAETNFGLSYVDEVERFLAVHEAGHILVGSLLLGEHFWEMEKATIQPWHDFKLSDLYKKPYFLNVIERLECDSAGYVHFEKRPGYAHTYEAIYADVVTDFGGMAAEHIVREKWTPYIEGGGSGDIENASHEITSLIRMREPGISESRFTVKFQEIDEEAMVDALLIVLRNRPLLDKIVEVLLRDKTVKKDTIQPIIDKYLSDHRKPEAFNEFDGLKDDEMETALNGLNFT